VDALRYVRKIDVRVGRNNKHIQVRVSNCVWLSMLAVYHMEAIWLVYPNLYPDSHWGEGGLAAAVLCGDITAAPQSCKLWITRTDGPSAGKSFECIE